MTKALSFVIIMSFKRIIRFLIYVALYSNSSVFSAEVQVEQQTVPSKVRNTVLSSPDLFPVDR